MSGNLLTRSQYGDLGAKGLGAEFEDVFEQNSFVYDGKEIASRLFGFYNTDKALVRTTGMTGVALPSEFAEGTPLPKVQTYKTFETNYSIRDYGNSIKVTDDMLQDREQIAFKLGEMAQLAKSHSILETKAAFQILNSGFGTAATAQGISIHRYNSAALFQASHARADGGTAQSNYSAGSIALSELNLETGRLALIKQLSDIGLPIMDMGRITLVVPDDLEKTAVITTQSELRPSTANNDINFYRGRIDVLSSRWLNSDHGGSATAWFLVADLPMGKVLRVYRKGGPTFKETMEGETWNMLYGVKNRFAVGFSEWKGTWGSAGA